MANRGWGRFGSAEKAWTLIVLMTAAACVVGFQLAHLRTVYSRPPFPLWMAVVLVAGSHLLWVNVKIRRQTVLVDVTGWAALFTVVFLSPEKALAVIAAVSIVWVGWARTETVKTVFNCVNIVFAAIMAASLFRALIGSSSPTSLRGWAAIAAGVIAFELLSNAMIFVMVWLHGAFDLRRIGAYGMPLCIGPPINAVLAVVSVTAAWTNVWAVFLIGFIPALALVAGRAYGRLAGRYANLEVLYRFTQQLASFAEENEVLDAVLAGLLDSLACERAQLLVRGEDGIVRYERREGGELDKSALKDWGAVAAQAIEVRGPVLLPLGAKGAIGAALIADGFKEAMAIPIAGADDAHPRVLVVGDCLNRFSNFDKADLRLMEALAAHSAVALRGSRLLDELRSEVATRNYEALHDTLTGLGNRALFTQRADQYLLARTLNRKVAVMLLDLDGFKEINDTLGHDVGDKVLQMVAGRLVDAVGTQAIPTRLGGDEFAIVVPDAGTAAEVQALAKSVVETVAQPIELGRMSLTVLGSIGVSISPEHGTDTSSLLKRADVAMYSAKGSTERVAVYDWATDQHTTRRLLLASELRRAIATDSMAVYFQPKADLGTERVAGFEALLRWTHPVYGPISPTEFIPVAEQAGLVDALTWWVLAESLRQQQEWELNGFETTVAVNISARSLLDTGLAARLQELLAVTEVSADRLVLEVTESSMMVDRDRSAAILAEVAALGVRISIDDFGTGYSSLGRLRELPVHEIKVDRSFVTTMLDSEDNRAIVSSTIDLALSMGRQVTAEGVEDTATWHALRELGCHFAQGYLLARPMPGPETVPWLQWWSSTRDRMAVGSGP